MLQRMKKNSGEFTVKKQFDVKKFLLDHLKIADLYQVKDLKRMQKRRMALVTMTLLIKLPN